MIYTLELIGPVPAKKNRWKFNKRGGMYFDRGAVAQELSALTWQAKAQWGGKDPLDKPTIEMTFYCKDQRSDIDNKLTAILDILQVVGVIVDDNVLHLPGPITIKSRLADEEKTVIVLNSKARK